MLARRLTRLAGTATVIALVAGLGSRWQHRLPPGSVARRLSYGGSERRYILHSGPSQSKLALTLVLHGMGGDGRGIERRTGFDAVAEPAGIVVAYPDAIAAVWNDGWWSASRDDVGFLTALTDSLVREFGIDPARVYVAGFSNGACMAHRLACETDRFTAVAAVSGTLSPSISNHCSNTQPVSVIHLHGTDDPRVPYDEQVTCTVAHWVTHDECPEPGETLQLPDVDPTDGTRVSVARHTQCRAGSEVALYTIEGGGHTWPGEDSQGLRFRRPGNISRDIDANHVIVNFFLHTPEHPGTAGSPAR